MSAQTNPISFTDVMADILRLPDETLAMSYIYLNKYKRFQNSSVSPDPLDPYTLSLATLSLATKSTESPRRLRELLLPAHRLLHPSPPSDIVVAASPPLDPRVTNTPLIAPSPAYDVLRATLVSAELLLLRVLGFELRFPLPLDFLDRYLSRALEDVADAGEDYDSWDQEAREEYGVVGRMDTGLARACRAKAVDACKNYRLANFFPARAIMAGSLYLVLQQHRQTCFLDRANTTITGTGTSASTSNKKGNKEAWLDKITSGKVDAEDFDEVLEEMGDL